MHTQPAHMRACTHMVCPWAHGHAHRYTWLSCWSVHTCALGLCIHTHACTHSSHPHRRTRMHTALLPTYMHIYKCPAHTRRSTHTYAIAVTVWADAKLFYPYTHVCTHVQPPHVQPQPILPTPPCKLFYLYVCTHIRVPNCPASTHTHMHTKTIPLAAIHTWAHDLSASMCTHTAYVLRFTRDSHTGGVHVCKPLRTTLCLGPSTPQGRTPSVTNVPQKDRAHGLLGPLWKQRPGTSPGFWSPATAAKRGVRAPSPARP